MNIQSKGLAIDYTDNGTGNTTLLFVHGSFIDKEYWDEQVAHFSPSYRVVTMDLAAHGRSGTNRSDWSFYSFGEDILAVVRELHLRNVILVCHSMGCDVALEAIHIDPGPFIGYVAVDYFKLAGIELPEQFQSQVDGILSDMRTNFADTSEQYARVALFTEATPPELQARIVHDYRNAHPEMGVQTLEELFGYALRQRELLKALPFKLYLINCDYIPTEENALKMYAGKGYELIPIRATSHYPMVEVPEAFNKLLAGAIHKIEKGK